MLDSKNHGQVFTPPLIVDHILEMVEYYEDNIYTAKIMEPSFGDGAFLTAIISKIIEEVKDPEKISQIIQENVYGIEKDAGLYQQTLRKLKDILYEHNILNVNLEANLHCGDTLELYKQYQNYFDIVIGNPPYVRIHNISNRNIFEGFEFSNGNTDLYILFYEAGLKMLNSSGKLGFITPNSFLRNTSQQKFRDYLIDNKLVQDIFDFKNIKVFPTADTYTCICVLSKDVNDDISYYECKELYDTHMLFEFTPIKQDDFVKMCRRKTWNLSVDLKNLTFLENNQRLSKKMKNIACIQNGVATLRDGIFIGYAWEDESQTIPYMGKHTDECKIVYFNNVPVESNILHRCIKASKFDGNITNLYIIYPYNNERAMTEHQLKNEFPYAYQYLLANQTELLKRDMENNKDWFLFGRSQGLKNINNKKVIFKHIINKNNPEIKAWELDTDFVVYSGMFITGQDLYKAKRCLESKDFARYCCLTGKDMSGGYVSVSTKIVKEFGIQ